MNYRQQFSRNVGPCVLVEAAIQGDVITNWPTPVSKVQKLEYRS